MPQPTNQCVLRARFLRAPTNEDRGHVVPTGSVVEEVIVGEGSRIIGSGALAPPLPVPQSEALVLGS